MTLRDPALHIRPALATDVRGIRELTKPYVESRAIAPKASVAYYEGVQEFLVVEREDRLVGCGALHVMWEDVAEVRTLAVAAEEKGQGIGSTLLESLLDRARELAVRRVFCLTFEVDFFEAHGFSQIDGDPVAPDVFAEMLQSYDEGVAEFLDLDRVKPNTLGNHRMLLTL
jgi:N-acetylglutamate synthase and related acetyltransferases